MRILNAGDSGPLVCLYLDQVFSPVFLYQQISVGTLRRWFRQRIKSVLLQKMQTESFNPLEFLVLVAVTILHRVRKGISVNQFGIREPAIGFIGHRRSKSHIDRLVIGQTDLFQKSVLEVNSVTDNCGKTGNGGEPVTLYIHIG